MYEEDDAFIL